MYVYLRFFKVTLSTAEILVRLEHTHELRWSSYSKMAITKSVGSGTPNFIQFPVHPPSPSVHCLFFTGDSLLRSQWPCSPIRLRKGNASLFPVFVKCLTKSTEESQWSESETLDGGDDEARDDDIKAGADNSSSVEQHSGPTGWSRIATGSSSDTLSLGIREPVYEVVEVKSNGMVSTKKINRRHLLKSSGLRPRDVRSVDPSLWLTNTMPSLLVREHAILLNLGSLRAIAMQENVFIFNYNLKGGKAFIDALLPRLNPKNMNGGPSMPFELEGMYYINELCGVVEAALHSRIHRLERRLMELEPRVQAILEVLPNRLTGDILEQLRISKQTLVELDSKAGALKQMLLDILEDPYEIRRICIMGRDCTIKKGNDEMECSVPLEKQIAEEEEEEIEMLLENYLQRCESCHGHAERLLDSAREMEDSIAVNLSSRRLEVGRLELLLQVGTFCVGVGALIAGIFGMNLKSYLEEHVFAFWLTTAGIIFGAVCCIFSDVFIPQGKKNTVKL